MAKKSIKDVNLKGKNVLVRVDFNVPRDKETGRVTNDERIRRALPTIQYLREEGAKVILVTHLGRPKGEVKEDLRLDAVRDALQTFINVPVKKINVAIGEEREKAVASMKPGDVLLLENIRFYPGEEANDEDFAKALAEGMDCFVNDAFGTAHRAHASTAGVAAFLPAISGLLMEKEISVLSKVLEKPEHPFIAIVGGAKISDKIGVIKNMLNIADVVLIGGGMANTFLKAEGYDMQKSLVEDTKLLEAKEVIELAEASNKTLLLPTDMIVSKSIDDEANAHAVAIDALAEGDMALDIGPATREVYAAEIQKAKTVFWNGPMGVFEVDAFAEGTNHIAQAVADSDAYSIIGGGDSVAAIEKAGLAGKVSHISTGGGASLEFLENKVLPGVGALEDK